MSSDAEIKDAILLHESDDPKVIARELSTRFQRYVPATLVMQVRGSLKTAQNVALAREQASETLSGKLAVADEVASTLLEAFRDEARPFKERIEASKELRQYLKLSIDSAGIYDEHTQTTFIIGGDWAEQG